MNACTSETTTCYLSKYLKFEFTKYTYFIYSYVSTRASLILNRANITSACTIIRTEIAIAIVIIINGVCIVINYINPIQGCKSRVSLHTNFYNIIAPQHTFGT